MDVEAIGWVRSTRSEAVDDGWDREHAVIALDASQFSPDALIGLEEFSHVEVIYLFHELAPDQVVTGTRRPRGNPEWPAVGIFAQRGRNRPNRLGLTICSIESVHDLELTVGGLDAIEGTPVLDLKPYFEEFGPRGAIRQPTWSREIMASYW